ncbi:3229_t:CDS:2 [Entrophospora sp. SA101]|nr:574_t:CDS:2 [Entrophospora sp. SA101]CAJ0756138.1 3229_t:CDS:2 [Entrophospora sp. SA101]CAJ0893537.1 8283_t:CDS:2 [Entrophospora sp. SA101]CAJ0911894.1 14948_t:CDS:2 [Entrophospora sp. SA101]
MNNMNNNNNQSQQQNLQQNFQHSQLLPPVLLLNKDLDNIANGWSKICQEIKVKWRVKYIEPTQYTPANITFLCFQHEKWNQLKNEQEKIQFIKNLIDRINKSSKRYFKVFLLLYIENNNLEILYDIQIRLLSNFINSIMIMPVHNSNELLNILKSTKNLKKNWVHLVSQMSAGTNKLELHDCYILQECFQTIYNISNSTMSQLLDASLDKDMSENVLKFFEEDFIS